MTDETKVSPAAEKEAEAEPQAPKVDPEKFALRGQPARVDRFKRSAIVGGAAIAALVVSGAAWMALKPASFVAVSTSDHPDQMAKATAEIFSGVPATYGDVPKLGRPLSGDLGRPILEHERSQAMDAASPPPIPATDQLLEAERQRVAAERISARHSAVMMATQASDRSTVSTTGIASAEPSATPTGITSASVGDDDANGQNEKRAFVRSAGMDATVNPHVVRPAISRFVLSAGSVIAASLITGINSDLPGLVTAQVTQNVFDSPTGRTLLIPQGTRLIGTYDSAVSFGQKRALLVWQRLVFPDGSSLEIDNVPGSDLEGYAGLTDRVDGHDWQIFKGILFSTVLGVGTELGAQDESDLVRAVRESTQRNAARVGEQMVGKTLGVQPTIKVRPGWPLRLVVQKDLVLKPWNGRSN